MISIADARWLIDRLTKILEPGTPDFARLVAIENSLLNEPLAPDMVYVVAREHQGNETLPIVVRMSPDSAFKVAQIWNLAGGEHPAGVFEYDPNGIEPGLQLEIPSA